MVVLLLGFWLLLGCDNFTDIHRQIYKKLSLLLEILIPPKVLQNETFEFSISRLGPLKEATLFFIKVNNLGVIIVNLYFCQTSIYGIHHFK